MARPKKADGDSWIADEPAKDGYYHAHVSMGVGTDGKRDRRHRMSKDLNRLRRVVKALEAERDAGVVTKKGKKPTVREMLERHFKVTMRNRGRSANTIYSYRSVCVHHVYTAIGHIRIDRVRDDQVEDMVGAMRDKGLAASTCRKALAVLSAAYELQVKRGQVGRNPCDTVDPPELGPSKVTALSEDEADKVFAVTDDRKNPARWSVGLSMGLRQGEALGLRWPFLEIDVPEGEVGVMKVWWQIQRQPWEHGCVEADAEMAALTVEKQRAAREAAVLAACTEGWHKRPCPKRCPKVRSSGRRHVCVKPDGKNLCKPGCTRHAANCPHRTGGGIMFVEIKEKGKKTLPIPPELVVELREHRDAQFLQRTAADREWEENELVFCQWNGRPIDQTADWREWRDILVAAGIIHRGVHGGRHSAATIMLHKGVDLSVVQELLGHSDIRVTRSYVHVSSPMAQDAAKRMGEILRKKAK